MAINDRLDFGVEDDESDEDAQKNKYLLFQVRGEEYGIEIRFVIEIIGIQKISEVPDMPEYLRGVINLRGKVIPIIDTSMRFGLNAGIYDDRTCIVVIDANGKAVGLIVDRVSEVLDIPDEDVEAAPEVRKGEASRFIQGLAKVGERVKIILNVERLLWDDPAAA